MEFGKKSKTNIYIKIQYSWKWKFLLSREGGRWSLEITALRSSDKRWKTQRNMKIIVKSIRPFFRKWGRGAKNYNGTIERGKEVLRRGPRFTARLHHSAQ